jgi:hypothetical protein
MKNYKEVARIRKNHVIHFIGADRYETVIETDMPDNPYDGMIKTDRQEYSVYFIQNWRNLGFLKIYRDNLAKQEKI